MQQLEWAPPTYYKQENLHTRNKKVVSLQIDSIDKNNIKYS